MSVKWFRIILSVACIWFAIESIGQGWSIEKYTEETGLPTEYLYAVTSYNNEILLGSDQGLISFDGVNFEVLDHLSRTYPVYFYKIAEDSLLISTYRNGLFLLNNNALISIDQKLKSPKIFGSGHQYLLYDNRKKCIKIESLSQYPERLISKFRDKAYGYKIHAAKEGIYTYFEKRLELIEWNGNAKEVLDFDAAITSVLTINNSKFIGLSYGQVLIIDDKGGTRELNVDSGNPVFNIYYYDQNKLLVNTRHKDANRFFLLSFSGQYQDLESAELIFECNFEVNNVHIHSGLIDIGSFGHGLHILRPKPFTTIYTFPDHLPRVESIIPIDDKAIYCKSNNSIFQIESNRDLTKAIIEGRAVGLFASSNGRKFLSSLTGLYNENLELISSQEVISDFITDDTSLLGYGKYSFFKIDFNSKAVEEYFTISKNNLYYGRINCGAYQDDKVYLGTDNGIVCLSKNGNSWYPLENQVLSSAYKNKKIQNLLFVNDTLHVVADGELSAYFNNTLIPSIITRHNDVKVNTLSKDADDNLMVGSNKGFYYQKNNQLLHYYTANGLSSNQVYDFYLENDSLLWVTTGAGVDLVSLDNLVRTEPPEIYFDEMELEESKVEIGIKTKLEYNYKNLSTQFKINSKEWNNLKNSNLVLHNLEPGDYRVTFRSKQTNSGWSEPIEYKFKIYPKWYQTKLFKILVALGILGCLLLIFRWRLKISENQRRILESEVSKRKALALKVANLREEISQDFHDDIGNKIASIGSISSSILDSESTYDASKIEAISKLSSEIYGNTKDFVWLLNPDNNNIHSLCQYIRDYAEQFFDMFDNIDFYYDSSLKENGVVSYDVIKNIVLTFKEITINTVKHSNASEFILNVMNSEDFFVLEASDNGRGFEASDVKRKSGLTNIEKRMHKIKAELIVNSVSGVKYTIKLKTPSP